MVKKKREASALAKLVDDVAVKRGHHEVALKGVWLTKEFEPSARHPVVYQPSIVVVAQGKKRGYLGDRVYHYNANNYLVLSVPLPFECEFEASADEPLLVVSIEVNPSIVTELLFEADELFPASDSPPLGIYSTPLDTELHEAVMRLLRCLRNSRDTRVLGPQFVREIIYRVLCGEQGEALRALANRNDSFVRIARVVQHIHTNYHEPLTVERLAKQAGMSTSMFHLNFKSVTASSPLQYLKSIRLHRARNMMALEGCNANIASSRVGYESASQFSREFRRMFGAAPKEESKRARARFR